MGVECCLNACNSFQSSAEQLARHPVLFIYLFIYLLVLWLELRASEGLSENL
jgi:hypothetical protein